MRYRFPLQLIVLSFLISGCYTMRPSNGGGEIKRTTARKTSPRDVALPPGYHVELLADGFTFPTDITFDDEGNIYVLEGGYAYGEVWKQPRLLQIKNNGERSVVAEGERNGPWTGVVYNGGSFYIAEGGEARGGRILRVSPKGEVKMLADSLPSIGDHHTNQPVVMNGYVYFGQGTATNSAVVGTDNANFGWLKRYPQFHDIPCADVVLSGENFETVDIRDSTSKSKVTTGAYMPYGQASSRGQVVKGEVPCNGAILRVPVDGGRVELVAWGLRNPFGLAATHDGRLFTTENAFDERGSRPVWGAGDVLWEIRENAWYGWPDYSAGKIVSGTEEFKPPGQRKVKPLLLKAPASPPDPTAILGVHSSSNGFDFSRSASFGFEGEAFIAQFGDMAPAVGKVLAPVGFKVIRVDVSTGVVRDFAVNKGKRNGPASWLKTGGLERPVSAKFDRAGTALYIVDFGVVKMTDSGAEPVEKTGVIWKVVRK